MSWKNDLPKDGSLRVGFPNAFYMQSSGDNPIGPVGPQVFYSALVIDILFAFLAAAAVHAIILRVRKATA
ncbi:hypothetical protein AAEO56_09785 [Flavobacterium sp. DGU11]|uniref:Uncharacterized protein n=1 Tax=Flavobacterium arundinis TaxID=3139143 RepID=A0ABU9HWJ9_9FLAO